MTKRGNGENSVYRRRDSGLYIATLRLEDGSRKLFAAKTRAAAVAKRDEAINCLARGLAIPKGQDSVEAYLLRWIESAKSTIRPNTYEAYKRSLVRHVIPQIGQIKLARLAPQDIAAGYQRLLDGGLSPRTVQLAHVILHRALSQAERWGLVGRNVATLVDRPRVEHKQMLVLTPVQIQTLIATARDDRFEALYVLALTTGMRWGEITGLAWRDVDTEAGLVRVRQQAQKTRDGWTFPEPKTAKGRRAITLPRVTVEALRRHRGDREQVTTLPIPDALVFPNELGRPLERQNFGRRQFKPLLDRIDAELAEALGRPLAPSERFPRIRFHDLRHSAATLLLSEGVHPKVVQERLGHASISITLDVYSHVLPSMQQETAERLDRFFDQSPERVAAPVAAPAPSDNKKTARKAVS